MTSTEEKNEKNRVRVFLFYMRRINITWKFISFMCACVCVSVFFIIATDVVVVVVDDIIVVAVVVVHFLIHAMSF